MPRLQALHPAAHPASPFPAGVRLPRRLLPLAVAAALPLAAAAQQPPHVGSVRVTAPRLAELPLNAAAVDDEELRARRPATSDSASLLKGIPGVSLHGAGGVSSLPSIRGLADDRLRIKVDGIDTIASCPNHMNPALSYIDPSAVGELRVYAGITPVSVGGDSIGGTIIAATPEPAFADPGAGSRARGEAGAFFRSNGRARGVNATANYLTESVSLSYAGAMAEAGNHEAGGEFKAGAATGRPGHALPLDEVGSTAYRARNHLLTIAHRGERHLVEAKLGHQDMPYQLYPNQRMDLLENTQERANLRFVGSFGWGTLEARAYHERVEHFMDFGADKRYWYGAATGGASAENGAECAPVGSSCAAGMPMHTESRTTGFSARADVPLGEGGAVRAGGEYQGYRLDDWWPPSGGGMWPDTFWNVRDGSRDRKALFAEWEGRAGERWLALAGIRYERVASDTGPVQAYNGGVAPATVLVPAFNGADRARADGNVDLTLLARHTPDAGLDVELGLARKVRSPSLYERYTWQSRGMEMLMVNWFGDGNGYLGNPGLEPEKAHTASVTIDWHAPDRRWELKATPYYTRVTDYVDAVRCPASLGGACTAANLAATRSFVFLQFANQAARLHGVDLSGRAALGSTAWGDWGLAAVASLARGKNLDTGGNLYNLLPAHGTLTLTHRLRGWRNALEVAMAGAKDDVSAVRNEVPTAGYALVNLRLSHSWRDVRLDFGVENLFDRLYALPLGGVYLGQGTTMTASPVGSVPRWGTAVPGMGRSVHAGVTVGF
ncbi:MAG: TonB-dependent receptor [Opitutaceae bacterium]|nr:TonB-dependent receptor [Opitutaceae bacterium]